MILRPTGIPGVAVIERDAHHDERGFFARLHCPQDFAAAGHPFEPVQTSLSRNTRAGTLRGLHWQAPPCAETKLVRVVRGRVFDVCVDVRPDSATYRRWIGLDLDAEAGLALLIGPGIAHGFLTGTAETDVLYQIAPAHAPAQARGARWDDPAFAIAWPSAPQVISARDLGFADFAAGQPEGTGR